MNKFNVYVTSATKIYLAGQNIVLSTKKGIHTFPFSVIQALMIENSNCTLSMPVINSLIDHNINVWFCDQKHLPYALLMPFNQYYQTPLQLRAQIELPSQIKKRVWEKIIKNKITNQALILEMVGSPTAKRLTHYSKGKIENIASLEAWTAKVYFKALFGKDFKRREINKFNPALNYGYSLIRSSLAKTLVSLGIQPALGIFHNGQKNNFNLADDLLEPFRPIVDYLVWCRRAELKGDLTREDKEYLFSLFSLTLTKTDLPLTTLLENYSNSFSNMLTSHKPSDLLTIVPVKEKLISITANK